MEKALQIIESGRLPPEQIMAKDADLLGRLQPGHAPILHLYEWEGPCLTYGYFIDPSRHLRMEGLARHGIRTARRPTGGGIILHLTDLAFSVLLPADHPSFSLNTLDNYAVINQKVAQAVALFKGGVEASLLVDEPRCASKECRPFCMAKPTQYDLMVEGKKVGGAAQRRTKQGLLHQGSLSLTFPPLEMLQDILLEDFSVLQAMQENSYCLLPEETTSQELEKARAKLKELLQVTLSTTAEIGMVGLDKAGLDYPKGLIL